MKRREFFSTSLLGSFGVAGLHSSESFAETENDREFYELRKYHIYPGSQSEKNQRFYTFLKDVAIPAFNRNSINPVGVFTPHHGSNTRELFVLLPHKSIESVLMLNDILFSDDNFQKDGDAVINSQQSDPVHLGYESSLMLAFKKMPKLHVPVSTEKGERRIFNLRIYEGHSLKANKKKIEMFNDGSEIEVFLKVGMEPVFFGETIIGPKLPNLTYMMTYPDYKTLEERSIKFWNDPEWVEMRNLPEYQDIVSNYNSLMLRPTVCSQI